jgi:hypothetical protein
MNFAKVMELVFWAFIRGRGGFSLPKSGRHAFAEAAPRRQAEVAPTHEGKVKCSFIYAKLNNIANLRFQIAD